jgi:hypothetical protein
VERGADACIDAEGGLPGGAEIWDSVESRARGKSVWQARARRGVAEKTFSDLVHIELGDIA